MVKSMSSCLLGQQKASFACEKKSVKFDKSCIGEDLEVPTDAAGTSRARKNRNRTGR
jgi:hypothetical protein